MKKVLPSIFLLSVICLTGISQSKVDKTYVDKRGNTHLTGKISLETLSSDTLYQSWYNASYNEFEVNNNVMPWSENLEEYEVDIYLGTWCGDSKNWVPKFVKLWDSLGLDRTHLNFTALYNTEQKYKQGPDGEEKGKGIHRVPTFIFKKQNKEVARIVENPRNDLYTDVAQIALGYPSQPSYQGAEYVIDLLEEQSVTSVYSDFRTHVYACYDKVSRMSELNTLGYVYLRAGNIDKALLAFQINTHLYQYNPNVYDSYGEALAKAGKKEEAIEQYKKVLKMDPENENAKEQLKQLEG